MKNKLFYFASALLSLALVACGSSNKVSNNELGIEIGTSKAHQTWANDPSSRAIGNGMHFREQAAINIAELQARGALARKIATAVKYAGREEFGKDEIYTDKGQSFGSASDQSASFDDRVEALSNQVVSNAELMEISRYKKGNQFNVYVCVGYSGGKKEIVENAFNILNQAISDDLKQKLRRDRDKVIKDIEESFMK